MCLYQVRIFSLVLIPVAISVSSCFQIPTINHALFSPRMSAYTCKQQLLEPWLLFSFHFIYLRKINLCFTCKARTRNPPKSNSSQAKLRTKVNMILISYSISLGSLASIHLISNNLSPGSLIQWCIFLTVLFCSLFKLFLWDFFPVLSFNSISLISWRQRRMHHPGLQMRWISWHQHLQLLQNSSIDLLLHVSALSSLCHSHHRQLLYCGQDSSYSDALWFFSPMQLKKGNKTQLYTNTELRIRRWILSICFPSSWFLLSSGT